MNEINPGWEEGQRDSNLKEKKKKTGKKMRMPRPSNRAHKRLNTRVYKALTGQVRPPKKYNPGWRPRKKKWEFGNHKIRVPRGKRTRSGFNLNRHIRQQNKMAVLRQLIERGDPLPFDVSSLDPNKKTNNNNRL